MSMFLGMEIGGTKLQCGIGTVAGRLVCLERRQVNRRRGAAGIRDQLLEVVPPLLTRWRVKAIGIGFGGPVNCATGRVVRSHQVAGWSGFDLKGWSRRHFGLPIWVENDANLAGLAEAHLGAGRDKRRVFYITVGTGIGGGLICHGQIEQGRLGGGEIGHTLLWARGRWRTVESLASGLAIERGVSHLTDAARYLGVAVANLITLVNPDVVVVGGGVSLAGEPFFRPLRAEVARRVFPPYRGNYRIVPARLGEAVVVIGAVLEAARQQREAGADRRRVSR